MNSYGNIDFYQLFNIDKDNFNESDLKKAYYRLSLQYHPDKNSKMGDMFKYINRAYEILNSAEKRKIYNEYGIEAFNGTDIKEEYMKFLNKSNSPHKKLNDFEVSVFDDLNENSLFRYDESSEDLTSDILNYSYLSTGVRYDEEILEDILPKKNKNKIDVTLEELYQGCEKQIVINRNVICQECFGNNQSFIMCDSCLGTGVTYNVTLEQEVTCNDCEGTGKRKIEKIDKCSNCHGKITINESKTLIAHILPGMKHNEKIIFKGEGDQSLKSPPNDIVAIINVLPHPKFTCNGNDLIINVKISLREALCGLRRRIKFLDGTYLSIMTNPGEVITPNSVKSYRNKGLIKNVGSKEKGNLKIKFIVQFPENNWTSLEDIKILEGILSKSISDKNINEDRLFLPSRDLVRKDYYSNNNNNNNNKNYSSPAPSIKSNASLKSNGSTRSNNESPRSNNDSPKATGPSCSPNTKLRHKKSVIDTFYQCDINAEGERNPRTISVVDPDILPEINPPRGISVIDSVIMPVAGESLSNVSVNSFSDNCSEKTPSPNMNPSPSAKASQIITPIPVRATSSMKLPSSKSRSRSPIHGSASMKITPTQTMNMNPSPINASVSMKLSSTSPKVKHISGLRGSSSMKNIKTSPSIKGIKTPMNMLNIKTSPNMKALRRNDDRGVIYSDEENFKTIKVVPNRALMPSNRNRKSSQDMEFVGNNDQIMDQSNGEFNPPPLPPFPSFPTNNKPFSHTRTSSLEHSYLKSVPITVTNSKGKIIHSNTFHGRDRQPNQNNYERRSKTIERINYPKYDQNI